MKSLHFPTLEKGFSHPFPPDGLHGREQRLELPDRDAVGGEDAHELHEEVHHQRGRAAQAAEEALGQAGLGAGLQVANGLAQRRREHGPVKEFFLILFIGKVRVIVILIHFCSMRGWISERGNYRQVFASQQKREREKNKVCGGENESVSDGQSNKVAPPLLPTSQKTWRT